LAKPKNIDDAGVEFVDKIARNKHVRAFLLGRLLYAQPYDFQTNDRFAGIIGDLISDDIRRFGRFEYVSLRILDELVLRHLPCKQLYCLDVGANIGNHALFFCRSFAQVIAFEPCPWARELLNLNVAMNNVDNVIVQPMGLSDRKDTAQLSICLPNLGGSFVRCHGDAGPQLANPSAEDVEIELNSGDSVVDPAWPVGFIKVDVEGMESQVIAGLVSTIERHHPVIMLEHLESAIDIHTGTTKATTILGDLGYSPYEVRRIVRSRVKPINDFLTYLFGNIRYVLSPIRKFEMRMYANVVYLTENVADQIIKRT
jgi:FkbM family methyltransferase